MGKAAVSIEKLDNIGSFLITSVFVFLLLCIVTFVKYISYHPYYILSLLGQQCIIL